MSDKRYYWLKLFDDFFDSLRIKKMRRLPRGDTYLIIYLKMQLLAMKHQGILTFKHVENSIVGELSLDLGEHPVNIRKTLEYLGGCELATPLDDGGYYLPYAVKNTGSETASAQRMRASRTQKTRGNNGDDSVTLCEHCYGEKEIEIESESEKETEKEKDPSAAVAAEGEIDGCCCGANDFSHSASAGGEQPADAVAEMLQAAYSAGFARNEATRTQLLRLMEKYGKDKTLEGIHICVKRGKFSPGYLEGCMTREDKNDDASNGDPFLKMLMEEGYKPHE